MTYHPEAAGGLSIDAFPDAGALALSDKAVVTRTNGDFLAPLSAMGALFRNTPAGSRSAPLPAALTASDHDRNVVLTGGTGTLSADATVADGFWCHVVNAATGGATLSGIQGLPSAWTTLAPGASATVMVVGSTCYAALSGGYGPGGPPIDAATFAGVL